MDTVLFSVTFSVSLMTAVLILLKKSLIKRYGFKLIYIFSMILAIRLLIPYCFPIPNALKINISLPKWLIPVWLSGAVVFWCYHFRGYMRFLKRIRQRGERVNRGKTYEIFKKAKEDRFIFPSIELIKSSEIVSPMLVGFIKPAVVIPCISYSKEEYEMIFSHELSHFQKKDNLKKLFFLSITALQWFNPFAYLLMGEAFQSLECLCDENVLKKMNHDYKKKYCLTLLKAASKNNADPAMVSYLNNKDKVKMRIENIWDGTKKRTGIFPLLAFFLTTLTLSSLLCGCMAEAPDDVINEMNRISSGVENENNKNEDAASSDINLKSVEYVTENALTEIDELNRTDGIFKFDNCRIIIPHLSEINMYRIDRYGRMNSPQKTYEVFRDLEKEWLGGNVIHDEDLCAVVFQLEGEEYRREDLSIEEYLKGNKAGDIYTEHTKNGSIEVIPSTFRLWSTPFYKEIERDKGSVSGIGETESRRIDCLYADDETLSEEITLADGKITLREAIEASENYMNTFKYTIDKKFNYRVQTAFIREFPDGTCALTLHLRNFCEEIPFVDIYTSEGEHPFSSKNIGGTPNSEMVMLRRGRFDQIITHYSDTTADNTHDSLKEIVPVSEVFCLIKNELSNSVVYDVTEIFLSYIEITYDGETYYTYPVWHILLKNGLQEIIVTGDAVSGELHISYTLR